MSLPWPDWTTAEWERRIREHRRKALHLGGKGSGHFGHAGRAGVAGGSLPGSVDGEIEVSGVVLRRATEKDAARIKELRVPPAWRDVHLSVKREAPLQAMGLDVKGRTQYRYSAAHSEKQAAEKFDRLKDFHAALPDLRRKVKSDLGNPDQEAREAAAVLYLIDKTAFRIGSDKDTGGDAKAHGATTLLAKHVKVEGDSVSFRFTGKKGVEIEKTVADAALARILRPRLKQGGRLFATSDADVRDYMQKATGAGFTPKDFRTYHGTGLALAEVKKRPAPSSEKELKRMVKDVAIVVSKELGNTPTVALKSYIDQAVFSKWRARLAA